MTKPLKLTEEQIARYHRDGFVAPVDVMSPEEADAYRRRLEEAERRYPEALAAQGRNNAHLALTCLDEIVHRRDIVDAAGDLIGSNILASDTVLFVKEPRSQGFVSWHQDYTYMGLEPHEGVSAWIALTPSTRETGCMQMIPGSHARLLPHEDTFAEDNILTRGQKIEGIDAAAAVEVELRPGQMSLHHPRCVHGSQPNTGATRRIGFVIQAYIPPHVHQTRSESLATLVRGGDTDGTYELLPRPTTDMAPEAVALWRRVNAVRQEVLYEDTSGPRRF